MTGARAAVQAPASPNVVVIPSAPALLRSYVGLVDPLADVRAAATGAVRWLVSGTPGRVVVLGRAPDPGNVGRGVPEPLSMRVARAVLAEVGCTAPVLEIPQPGPTASLSDQDAVLVVADGGARRGEKAPGHLDERAFGYDAAVEAALRSADTAALRDLDVVLGEELLVAGTPVLRGLGQLLEGRYRSRIDYAGDPFGVTYWVVRWQCAS